MLPVEKGRPAVLGHSTPVSREGSSGPWWYHMLSSPAVSRDSGQGSSRGEIRDGHTLHWNWKGAEEHPHAPGLEQPVGKFSSDCPAWWSSKWRPSLN